VRLRATQHYILCLFNIFIGAAIKILHSVFILISQTALFFSGVGGGGGGGTSYLYNFFFLKLFPF